VRLQIHKLPNLGGSFGNAQPIHQAGLATASPLCQTLGISYMSKAIIIFLLCFIPYGISSANDPVSDDVIYKGAISTAYDTAQGYVLIKVVNKNDQSSKDVCVLSSYLLSALAKENDLPYMDKKLKEIALSNNEHIFYFQKAEALELFNVKYTQSELDLFRQRLGKYSDNELALGFGATRRYDKERNIKRLHNLYIETALGGEASSARAEAYRDAIGCVLAERKVFSTASTCFGNLQTWTNEPDN
jgi:hypothetical protein